MTPKSKVPHQASKLLNNYNLPSLQNQNIKKARNIKLQAYDIKN